MNELIDKIPGDIFWTAVIFWFVGGATVWRFARYLERFRDAVRHATHHWERSLDFFRYARNNIAGMVMASVTVLAVVGMIGTMAWIRGTR